MISAGGIKERQAVNHSMSTQSAESLASQFSIPVPVGAELSAEVLEMAQRLGVSQHLREVVELTCDVFEAFTHVDVMEDPEFEGDIHIIFHVPARGSVEEELARESEWGRRLMQIIPRSPQVYLVFVDYPL
jgi:hypothetical protein